MKKVMVVCLFAAFVSASDYNDVAKKIECLKKKASTAKQNGLEAVAQSYVESVKKLQEQANKSNIQPA